MEHSALYRMDQQQQYIKGFFQAVQKHSAQDSGLVVRLFDRIQEYMVTNMTKDQYLKVAMDAVAGGKLGDEDFYTVPAASSTAALAFSTAAVTMASRLSLNLSLLAPKVLVVMMSAPRGCQAAPLKRPCLHPEQFIIKDNRSSKVSVKSLA